MLTTPLVLISIRGWVNPWTIEHLEELNKLKQSKHSTAKQSHNLPGCSRMLQPTTLWHNPYIGSNFAKWYFLIPSRCKRIPMA
jgi:hypothetical protein